MPFFNYSLNILVLPLLAIMFGFALLQIAREKHFSSRIRRLIFIVWAVFFVMILNYGLKAVQTLDFFRALKPEQVENISFYDENQDFPHCRPERNSLPPACRVLELTDPVQIQELVITFKETMRYAPNHESARERYLLRIGLKSGEALWLILGKGSRHRPDTAWLEFYSQITSGWAYGVYLDDALYRALIKQNRLPKWQPVPKTQPEP